MRRVNLLIVAGLRLSAARQPGFSIHHDLLAHPQFEVVFSESYISEADAKALLKNAPEPSASSHVSYEAEFNNGDKDIEADYRAASSDSYTDRTPTETYEIIALHPHRYLCSIPVVETPPAPNKTATELAKAEEAKELARASARGWELINGLDGTCLYFASGWWSYSFCYGQDVVQFHALPSGSKAGPPIKDPNSLEYVLGRAPSINSASTTTKLNRGGQPTPAPGDPDKSPAPPQSDLQIKGDQRFLVQKLEDGTVCDLTNRPRTIEIQYHCSPGSTKDRIGWIKEVTTCSYLMQVNTPRLCSDVAFQPARETRANAISCRPIVSQYEQASWHAQKTLEAQAQMLGQRDRDPNEPIVIGGVVVGGRQVIGKSDDGKEPPKLSPPRNFVNPGPLDATLIEIVAVGGTKDGKTKIEVLGEDELADLGVSAEAIEDMRQQIQEMANGRDWRVEVVDLAGDGREIRGVVGEPGDDDEEEADDGKKNQGAKNPAKQKKDGDGEGHRRLKGTGKRATRPKNDEAKRKDKEDDQQGEKQEGSEEKFFKKRQ